ncbi:hypothetical protein BKA81DRAFT_34939, partial [Phyllosticta paracitricarpa]
YSKLPAKQPSFGCSIQPATRLPFIFGTDCNHCFHLTARAPTSHSSLAYACLLAQTAPSSVSFRRSLRVHPQALHSHPRIPSASQPPSRLTSPAERVVRLHRSGPLIPHLHMCPPYHASSHMVPAGCTHTCSHGHTYKDVRAHMWVIRGGVGVGNKWSRNRTPYSLRNALPRARVGWDFGAGQSDSVQLWVRKGLCIRVGWRRTITALF